MDITAARSKVRELTEKINYHNDLYYQQDRSEISDEEFDRLLKELEALENQFPELRAAPGSAGRRKTPMAATRPTPR